ncbi:MAG: flagellar hook-associated protein FlgK [Eubacteriales bacterium]|jgi:flagellar hook-associated protein 1 FlgK
MSTFLGIEAAKRGLNANQIALNITGNNITNISSEGYTRQRVDTVSMAVSGHSSRFAPNQANLAGQGVTVRGITQIRDAFLDRRYRDEASEVGYYDKASAIMADIESVLDEYSSSGLKDSLAGFFTALSDLSKNSDQTVNANIVLTSAKDVVQVLNNFDTKLRTIREQQIQDIATDVEEVNTILKRIADLNYSINQEVFTNSINNAVAYGPNELIDERNMLIDKLALFGNISVSQNENGSVHIKINGKTAVDGTEYQTLGIQRNSDDTVTVMWLDTGKSISLESGSLKASIGMINGRGPLATGNETYDKGLRFYIDILDRFAENLMGEFNNVIPIKSESGNGTEYKKLFSTGGAPKVTAGNISISDEWMKDPAYIIDEFVDADGNFDNTYIIKTISLFNKELNFRGIDATFEEYVNYYNTTEIGQQVSFLKGRLETANSISNMLLDQRDAVSAVQLDEEGANLIQYQKAYNAIARVMTALDEVLDVLINKTGVVGR